MESLPAVFLPHAARQLFAQIYATLKFRMARCYCTIQSHRPPLSMDLCFGALEICNKCAVCSRGAPSLPCLLSSCGGPNTLGHVSVKLCFCFARNRLVRQTEAVASPRLSEEERAKRLEELERREEAQAQQRQQQLGTSQPEELNRFSIFKNGSTQNADVCGNMAVAFLKSKRFPLLFVRVREDQFRKRVQEMSRGFPTQRLSRQQSRTT